MMWLGIVLHVSANHLVGDSPLPWRDPQTTLLANLICGFIHSFRMPAFFILAGFFVALLVGRRDFGGMLKHRMRRIGLPFVIFWPPIFIAVIAVAMLYIHLMVRGSLGMDPSIMPMNPDKPRINTMHMWFIYYLLWFCVLTALVGVLARKVPAGFKEGLSEIWGTVASKWWGFIVLALPLVVVGSFYKAGLVVANGSFIPSVTELVHNGLFYVFGWYLYGHRETLLVLYAKNCWRYSVIGVVFFFLFLGLIDSFAKTPDKIPQIALWISFFYNCVSWLWSFALIGLFIRYLPQQNKFLRYISESSYWVYLVHMIFTVGFGVLLYNMPFNAITKMGLNILATTLVCIVSYHLLVRFTPISTLLNGHRFSFKTGQKLDQQPIYQGQ